MPRKLRLTWTVVLRFAVVVTGVGCLVVLGGGTALWLVEGERPDSTISSWGDALWWSLTTLTTVGYGDHVPVTAAGRLIAAGVMVTGVAIIGGVAAIVALVVTLRVSQRRSWPSKQQRKPWSSVLRCASLASRRSWLVWMHACKRGRRSQPMTLVVAHETINSG